MEPQGTVDSHQALGGRTRYRQEKLAAKAGLDRTYVGGAERGERNVALINIVRLAEALGIEPADLVLERLADTDDALSIEYALPFVMPHGFALTGI